MDESKYAIATTEKTELDEIHDKVDKWFVQPTFKVGKIVAGIGFATAFMTVAADVAATKMGGALPYIEPTFLSGVCSLLFGGIGFLGAPIAGSINDAGHEFATKKLKAKLRKNGEAMNQDMKLFNACVREQDKPNRLFRSVVTNCFG